MAARILIVDDYDDARELLAIIFEEAGYVVLLARNGQEAIGLAEAHRPHVVLMDIFMPGMSGVEATQVLKANEALRDIPVIAYTARPSPVAALPKLFDAVCAKPCGPDKVLSLVRSVIDVPGECRTG